MNKSEDLEEVDRFLDTYNPPKLNQEAINNLNRPKTCTDIESVIKALPTKKSPGPDVFTVEFCQTFQEELTPIPHKLFQTIERQSFQSLSMKLISP